MGCEAPPPSKNVKLTKILIWYTKLEHFYALNSKSTTPKHETHQNYSNLRKRQISQFPMVLHAQNGRPEQYKTNMSDDMAFKFGICIKNNQGVNPAFNKIL